MIALEYDLEDAFDSAWQMRDWDEVERLLNEIDGT